MKGKNVNTKNKTNKVLKKRVFVGMSGGVDSSVSAALLKEAGYDVTGVFIKVWSPEWLPCDWKEERRDAMRCAAVLEIPFLTLDLEKEYKEGVVDYMIDEYKSGRIPNPDVMCNKTVKFGSFFDKAIEMGADYVATGHYARTKIREFSISNFQFSKKEKQIKLLQDVDKNNSVYDLLAGKDNNKDQSYFLWTLTQKQLSRTLFPIGDLDKSEVRKLAEKFNLSTADKKDSQGLCFLGKIDTKEFLKRYIKSKKGKVLNENGEVIGQHDGAPFYSIGERHGFLITKKESEDLPYYIIEKDIKKNTLVVSHNKKEETSSKKDIEIENVSWTRGLPPETNKKYLARIRYREILKPCKLFEVRPRIGQATVVFDEPEESVAPGQSLVLYDGEVCLGGGVII